MKKLILLALICSTIALTNCKKTASPTPAAPAVPTTPTPTYTMTATETALVGDWIWDKTENYSANVLTSITTSATPSYTYLAGSHMDLKSTLAINSASYYAMYGYNWYNSEYYAPNYTFGAVSNPGFWYVKLMGGFEYLTSFSHTPSTGYIITLNSTTLIVQSWVPGQTLNGTKAFYHKL
jgi:hypothetical protein